MIKELTIISCGGAFGAVMRYYLSNVVYQLLDRGFPYGTMVVNILGSFLIGIGFVLFTEKMTFGSDVRLFVMVGLLGALTTFSTFSLETLLLMQQGELLKAGLNIILSVFACLCLTWLGMIVARTL